VYLLYIIQCSYALNNGLGRTPQMGKIEGKDSIRRKELCEKYCLYGNVRFYRTFDCTFFSIQGWSSWNHFFCNINETIVRQTADAMVATGLAAAGYQYGMSLSSFFIYTNHYFFITAYSEY